MGLGGFDFYLGQTEKKMVRVGTQVHVYGHRSFCTQNVVKR